MRPILWRFVWAAALLATPLSPLFAQAPSLRFGMEIKPVRLGIEVADMQSGRPVSEKLKRGDIFKSYEVTGDRATTKRVRRPSDIDELKRELASGETVLVTILRPTIENGREVYVELLIELTAQDLMPSRQEVRTETRPTIAFSMARDERPGEVKKEVMVGIYYATDRALENGVYTGERDTSVDPIKYGLCEVSIPPEHRAGMIERPSFWRFEFKEDPAQHVVLRNVNQMGKEAVFESIAQQFRSLQNIPRKRVLVFIHGYNNSFEDAALRTAQLHYDLDFPGVSMFYSWPSDRQALSYLSDGQDIEWSTPNIARFLEDLESNDGIDDVYLIAHSMGNRGLTKALLNLKQAGGGSKIKEIILAAADMDADLFNRDIAPRFSRFFPRTTIYASSSDLALRGSGAFSETARVGEIRNGAPTVSVLPKIDIIDASTIATDFVGHSYFGDNTSVISDIKLLVDEDKAPPRPFLKAIMSSIGKYWEFDAQ